MAGTFNFHGNHLTQPLIEIPGYGVMWAMGTTVPTDGTAGYGKGCIFIDTDGGVGTTMYVNEGSNTSCDFNAVT